eukprot:COSAG01_NODE_38794_length_485_cov_0.725389_1_plen_124_part_00
MADITLPVITCPLDIQLITVQTQPEELRVCRLYVLVEPTPRGWIVRYIGKTVQPLASRCAQHRRRARTDHLCAPLYRYAAAEHERLVKPEFGVAREVLKLSILLRTSSSGASAEGTLPQMEPT